MPGLEERLRFLETRLAVLEEESSEALQANYLTYDPTTGLTGAAFTGLISALGLILPAAPSQALTLKNEIIWKRTSDGGIVAEIQGSDDGTTEVLGIGAGGAGTLDPETGLVNIFAVGGGGAISPGRGRVRITGDATASVVADAAKPNNNVGFPSVTLIDGNGNSNFSQNSEGLAAHKHGDAAHCFLTANIAAGSVVTGIDFEPFTLGGATANIDPNGRITTSPAASAGRYTCRNTGLYLCAGAMEVSASANTSWSIGAKNINTTRRDVTAKFTPAAIATDGQAFCTLIDASAGDILAMFCNLNQAIQINSLGAGNAAATHFTVVQVM